MNCGDLADKILTKLAEEHLRYKEHLADCKRSIEDYDGPDDREVIISVLKENLPLF